MVENKYSGKKVREQAGGWGVGGLSTIVKRNFLNVVYFLGP